MIADLGYAALFIAFLAAVYAPIASYHGLRTKQAGWVQSGRNALLIAFPLVAIACITMVISLLNSDFSLQYVWSVSSRDMPTYLKVTALWGGQQGSILFFNFMLAAFTAAAMARKWDDERAIMPYAIIIASFTMIFFLGLSLFMENPFARIGAADVQSSGLAYVIDWPVTYVKNLFVRPEMVPTDGNGLNPLLRHPGMIIHPPMLYLGYTGFTVPFVFAMAALAARRFGGSWMRTTRRWTLTAWLFLGLGLILGGRWAYDVLGWGGYWAWDPVENSSLLPWLTGTAFLHSVMIQEKKGMFKSWNVALIVSTYLLVVMGTLNVRGGLVSSVHAFAESNIGWFMLLFLLMMSIFSAVLVFLRWDQLKSRNQIKSFLSRESFFMMNNFVFLSIAAVVFIGTYFPVISELVTGERVTVAAPFYTKVTGPLFAVLVILMGIAPLTMWTRTTIKRLLWLSIGPAVVATGLIVALILFGVDSWVALLGYWVVTASLTLTLLEFARAALARMRSKGENPVKALLTLMTRNRRRYGGYIIHLGVLIMAFGIISNEIYQQETQIRLGLGQTTAIEDFTMEFASIDRFPGPDDLMITEATVNVSRDGEFLRTLTPRTELYTRTGQPMTIPSIRHTLAEDFYVILVNFEGTTADEATFRIFLNPLINWIWAGAFIFLAGTLVAAWPDVAEQRIMAGQRAGRRRYAVGVSGD
ncbi:MAG: cytochrome c-type biogenesis CcmF C-terminal domain-containing protein [Chloroflexota bacterium]|jgi:cytochrome c-type biogenesis protein CcmF